MLASKVLSLLLFVLWSVTSLPTETLAQDKSALPASGAAAESGQEQVLLEDGTPVKLKLLRDLASTKERPGDLVAFEVIEEVKAGDVVVIPRGAAASGTVVAAQPAKRMGRTGKLDVGIDFVRLANDRKVNLRAVRRGPDGSRKSEMALEMAGTGLLFFPAAPLWLLQKGENINVAKDTFVTSFVNGDHRITRAELIPSEKTSEKKDNTQPK